MNLAVVLNGRGQLCLVHDERFALTPQLVRYDRSLRQLSVMFLDSSQEVFSMEISDVLDAYASSQNECALVLTENKQPVAAFQVPLITNYTGTVDGEEAATRTWTDWRAADYSWEGLKRKSWVGWSIVEATGLLVETDKLSDVELRHARPATLQDYWRDEESHLISGDGALWTSAHCPLLWKDGTPTPKSDWDAPTVSALETLISDKLRKAEPASTGTADRRAQLQGVVLFRLSVSRSDQIEQVALCLDRALILEAVHFYDASFAEQSSFRSTTFFDRASFGGCEFLGRVNFASANFVHTADFSTARFKSLASFAGTTFKGHVDFDSVKFSGLGCEFHFAIFRGGASFNTATFSHDTSFSFAMFEAPASFSLAEFESAAEFKSVEWAETVSFTSAKLRSKALFDHVKFKRDVDMTNCEFSGPVFFRATEFSGRMSFGASLFEKMASFEGISWPLNMDDWQAAFDRASFEGPASFVGSGFKCLAAYHGASFERGVAIDFLSERNCDVAFGRELKVARKSAKQSNGQTRRLRVDAQERRLRQLEGGCRVLKRAMDQAHNKHREQMLYRYELLARRAQRDTPIWEKTLSKIYGLTSSYGASLARPFLALAVLLVSFATIFYSFAALRGVVMGEWPRDAWQAWDFSWANVFKPFAALSADGFPEGTLGYKLLVHSGSGWTSAVGALATLQSLLAIVLAFLFGLAARRRFQIT